MIKLVSSLGIAILAAVSLTGCELYFGNEEEEDSWSYCGSDGFYTCEGNDCEWAGAECPAGGGGGFSCASNEDCASGCFCQDGICEEAGFCSTNEDCPEGFHCDSRSSCVPDTCSDGVACPTGQVCENGTCTTTCECTSDQEAQDQGFGFCDEATSTCYPGTDPNGSCGGAVTCATAAPNCPEGEVPLIKDGCFTGACKAIAQCDVAPECARLDNTNDCAARNADCAIVSTGINCTKPDGTACLPGDVDCDCESFVFNSCQTRTQSKPASSHWVIDSAGGYHDFAAMFH